MTFHKAIWKYEISLFQPVADILMPPMATIVHVDSQQPDTIQFWAEVVLPQENTVERHFEIIGTGQGIDGMGMAYIGTALDGEFVWHLYERKTL